MPRPAGAVPAETPRILTLADEVSVKRVIALNARSVDFYRACYRRSWASPYLTARLGTDLAGDDALQLGYAPAGWTALTDHLRRRGADDVELLAAGLSAPARTGRLIDRFRDRLVFPIHGPAGVLGFIARRHPEQPGAGPKYLNTASTVAYRKGAQLYGMAERADRLVTGAVPVLVEGPVDALAVDVATHGAAVGVSTLGTALTAEQADSLWPYLAADNPGVVVATDGDSPGCAAAGRVFWLLVARGGNPRHLTLPAGTDPASLLTADGPDRLRHALEAAPTLAASLVRDCVARYADRMNHVDGPIKAAGDAATVIGALAPWHWPEHVALLDGLLPGIGDYADDQVLQAGLRWAADPAGTAHRQLRTLTRPASKPA